LTERKQVLAALIGPHSEASDFAQAERLYRRCVDLDRTDPAAAFNLANLLRAHGRHGEAKV
jgi:Flp pilus assembly protein TadD